VRRLRKPYVVCSAGALPIYGRSKSLKRLYNWIVGRRIIQNANAYIAITGDERSHFEAYGVEANQVVVIPNGINTDNYPESDGAEFRRKYGLGDYPFILFVGRLNSIKGPDLLLRAFCKVKDDFQVHRMVFAGPDEGMLSELRETAAAHEISDRVLFCRLSGWGCQEQAFHASELVVIPSRQEAMSIVVLEAGIAGKPGINHRPVRFR
jgi:glycosyltransferase involved in cell wall biosynthesis